MATAIPPLSCKAAPVSLTTNVPVPRAAGSEVETTPPLMVNAPLQPELATVRANVPWSAFRSVAAAPAPALRSKALLMVRVLPLVTSIARLFAVPVSCSGFARV